MKILSKLENMKNITIMQKKYVKNIKYTKNMKIIKNTQKY